MGKRKAGSEDDSEASVDGDFQESTGSPPPVKKAKGAKGNRSAKTKRAGAAADASPEGSVLANSEGEKYIVIGDKRRVTARNFKGKHLIDIREFYGADGEEKPGKKGISLTVDQWTALKENTSTIDELITKLAK